MIPAVLVAFAWALLHSLWQGALIGLVAALLLLRSAKASATTRYGIAHGALWSIAGAVVATTALELDAVGAPIHVPMTATVSVATLAAGETLALVVLGAWTIGALIHTSRLALGLVGVHRLRQRAQPLPPAWTEALERLQARMGVRLRVAVAAAAGIDGPMVLGVLRPLVLVPLAHVTRVPSAAVEAALAHELAHVLRHDYLFNVLQSLIDAVLFFNPAARWLSARARVEREFACDELAVARALDSLDYACGLAELEGARSSIPPALAAHGVTLMSRITHILDPRRVSPPSHFVGATPSLAGVVLSAAMAFVVPACLTIGDGVDSDPRTAALDDATEAPATVLASATPEDLAPTVAVASLEDDLRPIAAEIDAAAHRHGVAPELLAIVTWVESRGVTDARSPIGARGLMQLMPKTAEKIARERGLVEHRAELLDDPRYNLDLGAYHLAELIADYGSGDELDADTIALAAAAYNGGRKTADAWLGGRALPEETARYSALVVALWNEREHQ